MGDDERHRIFMSRADVDEVDAEPIDLGDELRVGVQSRLAPPPVVIGRPIARECLDEGELYPLRKSATDSFSGNRVASMRRRMSSSSASRNPHETVQRDLVAGFGFFSTFIALLPCEGTFEPFATDGLEQTQSCA